MFALLVRQVALHALLAMLSVFKRYIDRFSAGVLGAEQAEERTKKTKRRCCRRDRHDSFHGKEYASEVYAQQRARGCSPFFEHRVLQSAAPGTHVEQGEFKRPTGLKARDLLKRTCVGRR